MSLSSAPTSPATTPASATSAMPVEGQAGLATVAQLDHRVTTIEANMDTLVNPDANTKNAAGSLAHAAKGTTTLDIATFF